MGEKSNNTARGFVFIHNHFFTSLSPLFMDGKAVRLISLPVMKVWEYLRF